MNSYMDIGYKQIIFSRSESNDQYKYIKMFNLTKVSK